MDARDLVIKRRCPVDLGALGVDRSRPRFFCEHCEQEVVSLSAMRESEALGFVAEMRRRGEGRCVSYAVDAAGAVIFAEAEAEAEAEARAAVVPVGRLRRPLRAAGALLALAACAPHSALEEAGEPEALARGRAEAPVVIPEARAAAAAAAEPAAAEPCAVEPRAVEPRAVEPRAAATELSRGKKKPRAREPMDVIDGFID